MDLPLAKAKRTIRRADARCTGCASVDGGLQGSAS